MVHEFLRFQIADSGTGDGTAVVKRPWGSKEKLQAEISYRFQETPRGAAIEIRTANREGIAALHEFLRFQIADHRTGDGTAVVKRP